jgi:hypothetical protein
MSEYVDTQLINCNRLASVESRAGNDENPAVFTNPLNQSVRLDIGDKVSLERAFISEVGAGNPSTIEFKGKVTGSNPVSTYTDIQYKDKYYTKSTTYDPKYRLGYYRSITTTEKTDDVVELRDNLAPVVIGYYITSNEYPNYIQQPRRFSHDEAIRSSDKLSVPRMDAANHYTSKDNFSSGSCKFSVSEDCFCRDDWATKVGADADFIKQKVNNKRFTLFIKDKIAYSIGDTDKNDVAQFPPLYNGIISQCTYYRLREKLNIEIKKGFNTPSAVADQITSQLKEVKNENIFEILDNNGYTRPITRTIETNTYKPINSQNLFNYCEATNYAWGASTLPVTEANVFQLAVDYLATFGYIGVKRPEIFEAGRKMMNELVPNTPEIRDNTGTIKNSILTNGYDGLQVAYEMTTTATRTRNTLDLLYTNVLYTRENCEKMMEFLDTQALYPELWDDLGQNNNYDSTRRIGSELPNVNNSRFIHMNKYATAGLGNVNLNQILGDDGFITHGTNNRASVPIFFKYNPDERNNFIDNPRNWYDEATNGLNFGCIRPQQITNHNADGDSLGNIYVIAFNCVDIGGIPVNLFTDAGHKILRGRRLGFDFHATAYGTAIITPYSGYDNVDIGTKAAFNEGKGAGDTVHTFTDTIQNINPLDSTTETTDLTPYQTMIYMGANNPLVSYNTTSNRFELSRLHTSNNLGNKFKAGNKADSLTSESMTPAANLQLRELKPPPINADGGNTVYKINPRPSQFGFSPTFKPYTRNDFALTTQVYHKTAKDYVATYTNDGTNTQTFNAWNDTITPFTVFDSHGGIYIDNWGFDANNWEDNLWDILGFDYNAVSSPASSLNVLTKRVDNENSDKLYRPTTNAEVVTTDTKSYITNYHEAGQFSTALPYPIGIVKYKAAHLSANDQWVYDGATTAAAGEFTSVNAKPTTLYNQVNIITQSTSITATDLKKSVLRPYYTIRSNILEGSSAIGGNPTGADLPIISIVDKYSAANDYFMGNPSDIQFTITKPTMLADITTSIHDSDGSYANVDKTSAVIYKIQKIKKTPIGLIQSIMEDEEKQNKKNKK